jgi:hypothetical protein
VEHALPHVLQTDVRLLSRVGEHVPSQVAGRGERLAARLTDVRLLSHVGVHVLSQVAALGERLAADLTDGRRGVQSRLRRDGPALFGGEGLGLRVDGWRVNPEI